MNREIQESLDEINDIMANVSSSYAIWRELTDAINRAEYENIKVRYEYFFTAIDYANFAVVINGLHMLFEEKSNTHNLKTVLQMQRTLGKLYEHRIDQWLSLLDSWSETTKKIIILRSNIFSHRGRKGSSSYFMKKAAITPDEIGELVTKAENFLKEFTEATSLKMQIIHSYSGKEAKDSTRKLMSALKAQQ